MSYRTEMEKTKNKIWNELVEFIKEHKHVELTNPIELDEFTDGEIISIFLDEDVEYESKKKIYLMIRFNDGVEERSTFWSWFMDDQPLDKLIELREAVIGE